MKIGNKIEFRMQEIWNHLLVWCGDVQVLFQSLFGQKLTIVSQDLGLVVSFWCSLRLLLKFDNLFLFVWIYIHDSVSNLVARQVSYVLSSCCWNWLVRSGGLFHIQSHQLSGKSIYWFCWKEDGIMKPKSENYFI